MINHPNRRKKIAATATTTSAPRSRAKKPAHNHEAEYPLFEAAVRETFRDRSRFQLFNTSAVGLYDLYIGNLASHRQVHTCNACKRFIEKFGALTVIDDAGQTHAAAWNGQTVPPFYQPAVAAMAAAVERAKITGPFYSREALYGLPRTGDWTHLHAMPVHVYKDRAKEPHEKTASKVEDFKTVTRALSEFTPQMLDAAIRIFEADALSRSEKFLAPAKWLRALHDRPKGKQGTNLLWRATADAPEGFCHPRSGVLGPLLENIAAGKPFDEIRREFAAMLHPLRYQRPQAAPSAGNIAQAEKLVEKLGIARSLERRFARLDEVRKIWEPSAPADKPQQGGVFGHLRSDGIKAVDLPSQTMTWVKFAANILPTAERMEFAVPMHGNFLAMTTAVHADAPPILQWDREDDRYPVAHYIYHGGSAASQWGLIPGWRKVNAIAALSDRDKVVVVIDGARDSRSRELAIFPETLKAELHGVRSTIEAHSKSRGLEGSEEASACGYLLGIGSLRVFARGAWSAYHIDRWD